MDRKLHLRPEPWPREGIDLVLAFLPIFESADFLPCHWPKLEDRVVDGKRITPMPYPIYHDSVDDFFKAFGKGGGWVDPYAPLPEDPNQEGIEFNVFGTSYPLEWFEKATVNQIRRYLGLCQRGERFCDGHIAGEFERGVIVAALRRLKVIQDG